MGRRTQFRVHTTGARRRLLDAADRLFYTQGINATGQGTGTALPAGYRRPAEIVYRRERPAGRFEYHTCHEEGFILAP